MALPWAAVIFALLKKHSPPYTFGPGIAGLLIYHYCPGTVRVPSPALLSTFLSYPFIYSYLSNTAERVFNLSLR